MRLVVVTPIALIVAAHLLLLLAWWFLPQPAACALALVPFAVALLLGSYEHFGTAGPNNVLRATASPGILAFRSNSVPLFLLELSACGLTLYSACIQGNNAPAL